MSDAECRDAVCGFTEAIVKDMIDEDFGDELFNAYSDLFDLVHSSYTGEEVDYDNDDEREARKLHQQIQWIKHLEPGQVPDALVAEFIAIKEGVIRLEEMFTLHSDDHRDDVTRTLGEERRAIIKMGDALNAAIEELMVKLGKTYEDIIEDLRSGACQDCENRDECLGGGAA
jgi:hypothetical protein